MIVVENASGKDVHALVMKNSIIYDVSHSILWSKKEMNWKTHLILFFTIFIIAWGTYAMALTPFMFLDFEYCLNGYLCIRGIDMTIQQYLSWLWQGLLIDLVLAYPVGRLIIWRRDMLYYKWKKLKEI